jgi:YidC/Oxa1 family membrane protein insertase
MEAYVGMLVPLSIWSALGDLFNTVMTPLYWAVSGVLVLFHAIWSQAFGANSGWTWALSIVCLTVLTRVVLIPLFVRQIKSSRNMQLLQPQIKELQKKYGHDRQRLGQETMKLYRENNANPMASCLPLLLQSPIFIALFRVLEGAAGFSGVGGSGHVVAHGYWLEHNPGLLHSLNQSSILGARLADRFWPIHHFGQVQGIALVMIVLMTATMFFTQIQLTRKNMPKDAMSGPMGQQQKMMLYLFPIFFLFIGVNLPIGVLFYLITSQLWTMGQQFYVIRRNPAPNTDAYAAWERRQKAKTPTPPPAQAGAPSTNGHSGGIQPHDVAPAPDQPAANKPARQQPARQQPRRQPRSQRRR